MTHEQWMEWQKKVIREEMRGDANEKAQKASDSK